MKNLTRKADDPERDEEIKQFEERCAALSRQTIRLMAAQQMVRRSVIEAIEIFEERLAMGGATIATTRVIDLFKKFVAILNAMEALEQTHHVQ